MYYEEKPTEEEIISNSLTDKLYQNKIQHGTFFYVVHQDKYEDKFSYEFQTAPRTKFQVLCSNNSNKVRKFELTKITHGSPKEKVVLSLDCFEQLCDFMNHICKVNIDDYDTNSSKHPLHLNQKHKRNSDLIKKVMSVENIETVLQDILNNENITSHDIVNTGYRKSQLEVFRKLLEESYIEEYKNTVLNKPNTGDEKAWQYFFNSNHWIFGYGLNYRFQDILQDEFHASNTDASGRDGVITDYLLGDTRFTSFVEIKLPNTILFKGTKNRSGCWCLSNELFDAYSQALQQKTSGQQKISQKPVYKSGGEEIRQNSYDSKTILIIGNLNDIEKTSNAQEHEIKLRTFELFRRDSRNVEIITYDELYDRAKFIVQNAP